MLPFFSVLNEMDYWAPVVNNVFMILQLSESAHHLRGGLWVVVWYIISHHYKSRVKTWGFTVLRYWAFFHAEFR